ncbi:DUF4136 domain-containing protein [Ferrimonas sediminicola]|uniref:DUF4136 domain-containing protein n=1 Tax=Ferrimonas sediminicola TaxID=2569538 RepID=A0A4U1B810_9GAMM|nr:DUF4136 domain-containing protein [Ferrimonas sediminicola]TKB46785.1 DUF4136 domain-containing protein [Ferrimonas sediminicola]
MRTLTTALLLLLSGCSANSDVDYDPGFDFTSVNQVQLLPTLHQNEPLAAERAETALKEALSPLGWQLAPVSPIKAQISLWQETEANDSGLSIGIGGGRSSGSTAIGGSISIPVPPSESDYRKIRLDLFDGKRQVWRATDGFKIRKNGDARWRAEQTRQLLDKLLSQIPGATPAQ